jgi:hypothetical protein
MSDEARHHNAGVDVAGHAHDGAHGDPDPEIRVRPLTEIMVVLAVVTVAFAALMWPLATYFLRDRPEPSRAVERIDRSRPAGPLLQVDPAAELAELRRQEQRVLDGYGWVDRGAGVARIPVERALELVIAEGVGPLAAQPSGAAPQPAAASATP